MARSPRCSSPSYQPYDWRPEGCDGKSKYRDRREMCFPSEELVSRTCPAECIIPAGKPYGPEPRWPPRCQSPCSIYRDSCKCVGKSSRPPFPNNANPCDYRLCSASEPFQDKVTGPHSSACADSCHQRTQKRNCFSKCDLEGPTRAPDMDAAGIVTRNPEYPWPPESHTIIRLDSSLKHQGVYKELGRIKGRPFWARAGDIMIVKLPRAHLSKDNGYVAFYTQKHNDKNFQLCPGDLLLRGDLIAQLNGEDNASKLGWYNPKTKNSLRKGDILIRAYIGSLTDSGGKVMDEVEAQVEIYMFTGLGLSWIYMGRDDCWLKDGYDIGPTPGNNI
ncbi:hypothetical protein R1sor_021603 [Riccia sorocarpa]|uniref:Uncharacterized protein n=1 Tax=Riccia sorocarpa TaxID=122646 RepID=A0ABD3GHI2_9MARC